MTFTYNCYFTIIIEVINEQSFISCHCLFIALDRFVRIRVEFDEKAETIIFGN